MRRIGRLIAAADEAEQFFAFPICMRCGLRLDRLPDPIQRQQTLLAFREIARHPIRYPGIKQFANKVEARLFVALEAERLRSATP